MIGKAYGLLHAVAALAFILCSPATVRAQQVINLATWGGGTSKTWNEAFVAPFRRETGIDVRITEVPSPETAIRAQASNPQYDLVLVDTIAGSSLAREGLLTELTPADYPSMADTTPESRLIDDAGHVVGVTPYFGFYSIVVNTDLAKPEDFRSWKDLTNPKWRGRLGLGGPVYTSLNDLTMMAIANGGSVDDIKPGLADMRAYVANATNVYGSMAQMNQMLTQGEVAGGTYYGSRIWEMKRAGITNVQMVFPKEGAIAINYAVVVPKGRPVTPDMKKFLDYMGSATTQLRGYDSAGYLPLNTTAKLSPAQLADLGMPLDELRSKLVIADPRVLSRNHADRVKLVEQIYAEAK